MMLHFTFVVITGNPQAAISAALFGQGSIMLGEIPTSREEQNSGKHSLLIHRRKIVSKPPGYTVDSKKDITPVLSILPNICEDLNKCLRSGYRASLTVVGTATM